MPPTPPNFMLFSELQKKVSPSPIKTWRLLDLMRRQGRMREGEDYRMIDRTLYVNVPRFVVEMEAMGYAVKSDDNKDDIKKLYEEMRLIADEITNSRIQQEIKSPDNSDTAPAAHVQSADITNAQTDVRVKSGDISDSQHGNRLISPEITHEEPSRKSDGISATITSPEINLKSPEFNLMMQMMQMKDEVIASKRDHIQDLKAAYDDILQSKDEELREVRHALDAAVRQNEALADQNKTLVHQNVFLTNLITAPKTAPKDERTRQYDDVPAPEFKDMTEGMREREPVSTAAHDATAEPGSVPTDLPPTAEAHLASDARHVEPPAPEGQGAQA